MNHGLIPGGVSLKTGRQAVFFTVVDPIDDQDGLAMRLVTNKNCAIHKYLETLSEYSILVQFEARSTKKEDCNFIKQGRTQLSSVRHCFACRVHRESDVH